MNALTEDILKVISLLEYQSEVYQAREVPITKEALDKFGISERDFTVALRRLLLKRPEIKKTYEHIDGDPHTGPEGEIEFYRIELPNQFDSKNEEAQSELFSGPTMPKKAIGPLAMYTDGSIRLNGLPVKLRAQLRDLCEVFIDHPEAVLNADDFKDGVSSFAALDLKTISKYVSELRRILKTETGKNMLIHKEPGWYLQVDS